MVDFDSLQKAYDNQTPDDDEDDGVDEYGYSLKVNASVRASWAEEDEWRAFCQMTGKDWD